MVPVLFDLPMFYCFNETSVIADSSSSLCWLQGTGRLNMQGQACVRAGGGSACGLSHTTRTQPVVQYDCLLSGVWLQKPTSAE